MFSLIVPAYNEGDKIYHNLGVMSDCLADIFGNDSSDSFEIIPVNDGSRDNTADEILRASEDFKNIIPVIYSDNKGKGGALIEGVKKASGDLIAFLDADLDINPDHFRTYIPAFYERKADIVIGSKMHKDSKLEYPIARKIFSMGYYVLLKILFGTGLKDTQTGIKIYRGDLIKGIVPKLTVKGYAFDIEILALALKQKATIIEMPVSVIYTRQTATSRIKFKDIWKMFTDTIGIWWRIRVKKEI